MSNKNLDKEVKKINSKSKIEKSKSKTSAHAEANKPERKPKSIPQNEIKKTKMKSEKKEIKKQQTKASEQIKSVKSKKKPKKDTKITKPKPRIKTEHKVRTVTKVKKAAPKLEKTRIYGTLVNYRLGHSSQHNREFLIRIPNVNDNFKASKFIGHRAIWQSKKGTKIIGNILCIHGKNGVLRARFRKGLPGQVKGKNVEII
jgi:large subunit ribosomal protein L35Ae